MQWQDNYTPYLSGYLIGDGVLKPYVHCDTQEKIAVKTVAIIIKRMMK